MAEKVKPYLIERVSEIPPSRRVRTTLYSELIDDLMKREKGYYKVAIEGKKPQVVYQILTKRIRRNKLPLKVYIRKNAVYIEKLE